MSTLRLQFLTGGNQEAIEYIQEMQGILDEYNQRMVGIDGYVVEAFGDVKQLNPKKIEKLLRAASAISKGEPVKMKSGLSDVAGKESAGQDLETRLTDAIQKRSDLLQATPVENFEDKTNEIIDKWQGVLGGTRDTHKTLEIADNLAEYGKKQPEKSAFVLATLVSLDKALKTPGFDHAAVNVMYNAHKFAEGKQSRLGIK